MTSKLKIPFGLLDNKLVTPTEVPSGLKCNCICPGCFGKLIANHTKSTNRRSYFSHYVSENCNKGYESGLHLAAKRVLVESKQMLVPKIYASSYKRDSKTGAYGEFEKEVPASIIVLDIVEEEVREFEGVVPDIVAIVNGKTLFIEIAVTHEVDDFKLEKLKNLMIPTIEIKLNPSNSLPTLDEIRNLTLFDDFNREWVFNPKLQLLESLVEKEATKRLELHKNKIWLKEQKILDANKLFMKLSDKEKLNFLLKELKLSWSDINPLVGKNVSGARSFGCSSSVWQLLIYVKFIHGEVGHIFDKNDIFTHLKERVGVKEIFKDSPNIAIHYYLKFLQDNKFIEYNLYSGGYFVKRDIYGDMPY